MATKPLIIRGDDGQVIEEQSIEVPDEQVNEDEVLHRGRATFAEVQTLARGTGPLTSTQLTTAVRLLARVALMLMRSMLRRFDGVD